MNDYREYLPELESTTLFRDMAGEEIIALLEAMQPRIFTEHEGEYMQFDKERRRFRMILRGKPREEWLPRENKYDMPKFGEPGMIMTEIPALECRFEGKGAPVDGGDKKAQPRFKGHPRRPLPCDMVFLEFDGEMMTRFYSAEVSPAQGKMLRNFLGILAQKVSDVRMEKFKMMQEYEEKLHDLNDQN